MKKIMLMLMMLVLLCGCGASSEKAACSLVWGNSTVTITEGRDLSADKDGQIISMKQTIQIDSEEPDVIVIYREYYEKELSEYTADENVKASITNTETGLLITLEFDVKKITAASKDRMMDILDADALIYETVLQKMKETGFQCGDEETESSESSDSNLEQENKEADSE